MDILFLKYLNIMQQLKMHKFSYVINNLCPEFTQITLFMAWFHISFNQRYKKLIFDIRISIAKISKNNSIFISIILCKSLFNFDPFIVEKMHVKYILFHLSLPEQFFDMFDDINYDLLHFLLHWY